MLTSKNDIDTPVPGAGPKPAGAGKDTRRPPRDMGGEGNRVRDTGKMDRPPIANKDGVLHLYVNPAQPEAEELKSHVEGMGSKNTDHDSAQVFNPAVSNAQWGAMQAARAGKSTLGIPASVGREFIPKGSKKPRGLPARKRS